MQSESDGEGRSVADLTWARSDTSAVTSQALDNC